MASEGLYWLMEMLIKGNGSRTRLMGWGHICIQMEQDTRVSGSRINKKVWAVRHGQMEVSMKACITMVKNMAMANSLGKMEHLTLETGTSTKCMATVFLGG